MTHNSKRTFTSTFEATVREILMVNLEKRLESKSDKGRANIRSCFLPRRGKSLKHLLPSHKNPGKSHDCDITRKLKLGMQISLTAENTHCQENKVEVITKKDKEGRQISLWAPQSYIFGARCTQMECLRSLPISLRHT
jgi:hypothetical protein